MGLPWGRALKSHHLRLRAPAGIPQGRGARRQETVALGLEAG